MNTFGLDDKGIKSRKKKMYGLKTEYSGKGHGKDAKKQKQSNGYSKKKKQRSFNYTIYPQENPLTVLEKLLSIEEDDRLFKNPNGINVNMKVKIKTS